MLVDLKKIRPDHVPRSILFTFIRLNSNDESYGYITNSVITKSVISYDEDVLGFYEHI